METILLNILNFSVEAVIMWQYSSKLFIAKYSTKKNLIVLVTLYTILLSVFLLNNEWLNALLFFLANAFYLFTQYTLKWYAALFYSAAITAILGMCELVGYGIISRFSPHFLTEVSNLYSMTFLSILSKMLYFFIVYILAHIFTGQSKNTSKQNKSAIVLGFIPISSIFIMLAFVSIGEIATIPSGNNWMIVLSGLFLLMINLLVFGMNQYNQQKNTEFTEMQVLLQKEYDSSEYYKMLLQQSENQSILIHDIKKHLQSIQLLNEKKECDKIGVYIQQLLKSSDFKESSKLCDHELMNAILSRYKRQCSDKKIEFLTDIRKGTMDFISDSDLTALFCNLLDNAMEAAAGIPDSYVEINTSIQRPSSLVIISVINSCRSNPFLADSHTLINGKTDKKGHGFGIKSIRKTIEKYQGNMQMYYNDDTLTFHTIITSKFPEQIS